ncbi:MAG: glycerophosphodiester phosphodiesterase family protein [Bacteroidetes bacterium]|nr:glycerophosphodiester phosphodiesterase family protein [Bacteroidota bacterium]
MGKLLFIGHRGTNVDADENTIDAFEKVIDYGADYIELDVRLSKNKKIFVIHNPKVDETTDGFGYIKDLGSTEIKKFKSYNFKQKIPTFEEVITKFKNKTKFIIDHKERNLTPLILIILKKQNLLNGSLICSANFKDLQLAKQKYENCKICYVVYRKKRLFDILNSIKNKTFPFKIDMLSLSYNLASKEINKICKENDILTLAWGFRYIKTDPLDVIKEM